MGQNSKKWVGVFSFKNAQKFLCVILMTATPARHRVQVPTPKNLLKVSNFGGAPIGGSLIDFDNKVVALGAPKEKINLASPIP